MAIWAHSLIYDTMRSLVLPGRTSFFASSFFFFPDSSRSTVNKEKQRERTGWSYNKRFHNTKYKPACSGICFQINTYTVSGGGVGWIEKLMSKQSWSGRERLTKKAEQESNKNLSRHAYNTCFIKSLCGMQVTEKLFVDAAQHYKVITICLSNRPFSPPSLPVWQTFSSSPKRELNGSKF